MGVIVVPPSSFRRGTSTPASLVAGLVVAVVLVGSLDIVNAAGRSFEDGDRSTLMANKGRAGVSGSAPRPFFRCPAMDMIQVRKIGPVPKMIRDGSYFRPDSRDQNIVKEEILQVSRLVTQLSGTRKTALPPTHVPAANVFPTFPERIPFEPASKHFFSCPDPRTTYAGMFTPGGDLGEFLLALTALERLQTGVAYGQQEVSFLLHGYLDHMATHGKFQFASCTDVQALGKLAEAAQVQDPLAPLNKREYARLLQLAAVPDYVGSRFFADAIHDPDGYSTRGNLVKYVYTAFVRVALDTSDPMHERTLFVPYQGPYNPQAFVEVVRMACPRRDPAKDAEDFSTCNLYPCHDLVPLINAHAPEGTKPGILAGAAKGHDLGGAAIVHRDDVKLFRAELAKWAHGVLRASGKEPPKITVAMVLKEMLEVGDSQLMRFKNKYFQTVGEYEASYLTNAVDEIHREKMHLRQKRNEQVQQVAAAAAAGGEEEEEGSGSAQSEEDGSGQRP